MLEKLIIQNFQCHEKLVLDLNQPTTTITGNNDAGKSAILRALKWVCLNTPDGDHFIRRGSNLCSVKLYADGCKVTRKKGKGVNTYSLDKKEYNAIGRGGIPEEIVNLLQVDTLNFQSQHDAPFWFSLTAGEVSREINKIVNLDLIDRVLSRVASDLRKVRSVVEVTECRLVQAKQREEELSWVVKADTELSSLEGVQKDISDLRLQASSLNDLCQGVREAARDRDRVSTAILDAGNVLSLGQEVQGLAGQVDSLCTLVQEIKRLQGVQQQCRGEGSRLRQQLEAAGEVLCPTCGQPVET